MGTPKEGGKPLNIDPQTWRVAPEQSRFGSGFKKPEDPKQQPSDPELETYRQLLKQPRESTVYKNPIRVPRPLPQKLGEQRGEAEASKPNPAEQQAAERLGKPPPERETGEVEQNPTHHQEHPIDSLDELRQLARRVLSKPPPSPEQLEGIKPENLEEWERTHPEKAAGYATARLYYEEAVENLAQSMSADPYKFTANLLRRILREREGQPKPPEK